MTDANPSLAAHLLASSILTFKSMKKLGDGALRQLDDAGIRWTPAPESNSVAVIVKHVAGNMASRWTDFLATDGEKPDRNRDEEFMEDAEGHADIVAQWERGWAILFGALESLAPEDVHGTVTIRGEAHSVVEAIHRQISHYGGHVGQIVYAAKAYRADGWETLSIPRGQSQTFNDGMKKP
ncbi:DUF1572 family protein [Cohnella nanjingensis]|uniref:DUF1572 family protein n=1 Tax=Cohnella nanjingensis TaxID=1387779 RepID=A0A7X0RXD2_9BACL|nr:DUF1572 family protein [Cohnella nanjingensis]MBB6675411.1 DUF1572 family protein [Cohnella nanjingensis]